MIMPVQWVKVMSSLLVRPQLTVPSPAPLWPSSSSSKSRKLRGTTTTTKRNNITRIVLPLPLILFYTLLFDFLFSCNIYFGAWEVAILLPVIVAVIMVHMTIKFWKVKWDIWTSQFDNNRKEKEGKNVKNLQEQLHNKELFEPMPIIDILVSWWMKRTDIYSWDLFRPNSQWTAHVSRRTYCTVVGGEFFCLCRGTRSYVSQRGNILTNNNHW